MHSLAVGVSSGDPQALARAATLVQNRTAEGQTLLADLFTTTGRGVIAGITGPPGAGKSTLVAQLTGFLRKRGHRVGILAIDPSSGSTRGAILGDRIRMGEHWSDNGVFIRSLATRGRLGGLAPATHDLALLLQAAGYDAVLIETVGVGQDEIDIAAVADVTVVVLVPGLGDDVQTMKAGILEIADVFAVNKSDLPGAASVAEELRRMQTFVSGERKGADAAPVRLVSAIQGEGIGALWDAVEQSFRDKPSSQRAQQWGRRLRELLCEEVLAQVPESQLAEHAELVTRRLEDPYTAVRMLLGHA